MRVNQLMHECLRGAGDFATLRWWYPRAIKRRYAPNNANMRAKR